MLQTDKEEINFQETFSPVARIESVRTLIAIEVKLKSTLFQMDVKDAFLYGDLQEEEFIE